MIDKFSKPPVSEGDIVSIVIESEGVKGDGIGKLGNFIVIIPNTIKGEEYKIKITRVLPKMAFAEKIE